VAWEGAPVQAWEDQHVEAFCFAFCFAFVDSLLFYRVRHCCIKSDDRQNYTVKLS
jgi:hypothetical protein